jgi:hypothetical protein
MSNKKELVKQNLEELSKRIGLMVKQYNLLAQSEDMYERLMLVAGSDTDVGDVEESDKPFDIYDLVRDYNEAQGWSSSSNNC